MHVIALHTISDPEKFFAAAESNMDKIPEGVSLNSVIPSEDHGRTVCVWEADSVDSVRAFVEETVGDYSANEYFPVDVERALGLPTGVPTPTV